MKIRIFFTLKGGIIMDNKEKDIKFSSDGLAMGIAMGFMFGIIFDFLTGFIMAITMTIVFSDED